MTGSRMAASSTLLVFLFGFCCFLDFVASDTPANCTYEDVRGKWVFYMSERGHDKTVDCSKPGPVKVKTHIELTYPDVAVDEYGNEGFWTLIYNQGFEVVIHGRNYFAFSKYEGHGENATSYCHETMPGWSHDVLGRDWACFVGRKAVDINIKHFSLPRLSSEEEEMWYRPNHQYIQQINKAQNTWTAGLYPQYANLKIKELLRRAGGRKSRILSRPHPAEVSEETKKLAAHLPEEFDWRDVDGVSFVSPVRNQESCGSCYAFSSMGMIEARLRVATNNSAQVALSPQDIVECSEYSQGCDGGFPYLVAGKYAEDFGAVSEECNPYKGKDDSCKTDPTCARNYMTAYKYVGGYYGACNEERMKIALVNDGPLSVSFEVYDDFMNYKGGIYQHTGLKDSFNPFELTNHAVLLVGYGVDKESGLKFWIVKNSWGEAWGESGYFRILRGVDECAIESIAVEAFPVF